MRSAARAEFSEIFPGWNSRSFALKASQIVQSISARFAKHVNIVGFLRKASKLCRADRERGQLPPESVCNYKLFQDKRARFIFNACLYTMLGHYQH
jgi:hypothetical protein